MSDTKPKKTLYQVTVADDRMTDFQVADYTEALAIADAEESIRGHFAELGITEGDIAYTVGDHEGVVTL